MLSRRRDRKEADATISRVEMLERISYGEAKVRVVYSVQPLDEPAFEAIRDSKVKMSQLPQAGQGVKVSFDPSNTAKLEVLTPPGAETGSPQSPTTEIPWVESARSSYIRPDGTRGSH